MKQKAKELELYLHIPFCVKKCRYCDFLSGVAGEELKEQYVTALEQEIQHRAPSFKDCEVTSVFFGGGTPSVLAGNAVARLLACVREAYRVSEEAEITVECNPGTLTEEKIISYKEAKVNRISLGLQSADPEELKLLGRIHTYEDFLRNYEALKKHGFDNINVDLMSALPGQTVASYERTVKKVLRLHPEHISAYSLIIEEGTEFYRLFGEDERRRQAGLTPVLLPSEETEREMYGLTKELLTEAGYHRYEISNYAKKGCECRHNTGYWRRKNYLGLGLGAASLVDNVRFSNTGNLTEYLSGNCGQEEKEILSVKSQMEEFMFLGLRLMDGVSKGEFYDTFGQSMEQIYGALIKKFTGQGLLEETEDRIFLTEMGIAVSNYVMSEFLLDD